jgi:hypothetical protein
MPMVRAADTLLVLCVTLATIFLCLAISFVTRTLFAAADLAHVHMGATDDHVVAKLPTGAR